MEPRVHVRFAVQCHEFGPVDPDRRLRDLDRGPGLIVEHNLWIGHRITVLLIIVADDNPLTHPFDDQGVVTRYLQPNVKIGCRAEGVQETVSLQDALHGYLHGASAHGYSILSSVIVSFSALSIPVE